VGAGGTARAALYATAHGLGLDTVLVNPRTPINAQAVAADLASHLHTSPNGKDGCCTWAQDLSHAALASSLRAATSTGGKARDGGDDGGGDDGGNDLEVEVAVLISTLPLAAGFQVPAWILSKGENKQVGDTGDTGAGPLGPLVVLDVAYKPALTPLLRQVLNLDSNSKETDKDKFTSPQGAAAAAAASEDCGLSGAGEAGTVRRAVVVVPGATMLVEQGLEQCERWTKRGAPRQVMYRAVLANLLKTKLPTSSTADTAATPAEEEEEKRSLLEVADFLKQLSSDWAKAAADLGW